MTYRYLTPTCPAKEGAWPLRRNARRRAERIAISWVGHRRTESAVDLAAEETMKLLKWVAILSFIGICVLLFIGKDDLRRMRQMRQM